VTDVRLTDSQTAVCRLIGRLWNETARANRNAPSGAAATVGNRTRLLRDMDAAGAECAASLVLGLVWPMGVNTFRTAPDIPPDWEVRNRADHGNDLTLTPEDNPRARVVHVTGALPVYRVHGWIYAADGRRIGTPRIINGRQRWFVSAGLLIPMPPPANGRID